jgi:hypothetical protein
MDVFSYTFLSAAAQTGLAVPTVGRHMPVFRHCVEPDDPAVLVARCVRPHRPLQGEFVLLLTSRRLVVTHESRMLRRLRLHLNTDLGHLLNVTWTPEPRLSAVELAATAVDGVRERFWIKLDHPKQIGHLDALLGRAFRARAGVQRAGRRDVARLVARAAPA